MRQEALAGGVDLMAFKEKFGHWARWTFLVLCHWMCIISGTALRAFCERIKCFAGLPHVEQDLPKTVYIH